MLDSLPRGLVGSSRHWGTGGRSTPPRGHSQHVVSKVLGGLPRKRGCWFETRLLQSDSMFYYHHHHYHQYYIQYPGIFLSAIGGDTTVACLEVTLTSTQLMAVLTRMMEWWSAFPPDSVPCSARVEGNSLKGGKEMSEGCRNHIKGHSTRFRPGLRLNNKKKKGENRFFAVCDDWISVVC